MIKSKQARRRRASCLDPEAWRAAVAQAPIDGCAALLRLHPFDGRLMWESEYQAASEALQSDRLIFWRIGVAQARRGRPDLLLAWLVVDGIFGPIPDELKEDVRLVIANPVRRRLGHRGAKLPPALVSAIWATARRAATDQEREQVIKDFAAAHCVHERTIKRALDDL